MEVERYKIVQAFGGHIMVYKDGKFVFSADNMKEVWEELGVIK